MSRKLNICCDNCDRYLTYSSGGYDHCLHLCDRKYGPGPESGGVVIDYYFPPILDDDKYFCSKQCLKKWLEKDLKNEK